MDTIKIEIPEEEAHNYVEMLEEKVDRIDNVLNSFRSNNLTDTEAYRKLEALKDDKEGGVEFIQEQIDEQTESEENEGLADLFNG